MEGAVARKITSLVAATILSVSWASGAAAAPANGHSKAAAVSSTGVAAAAVAQSPRASERAQCGSTKGLFDRLGGFFGIAAVVNRFSDEILTNPTLNQNPALVAWNQNEAPTRLPGLKFLRTMWIASMAGGPIKFSGQPLEQAHDRFNLTPAEFAAVGAEIVEALQFFNVAQADIDKLVCLYQTSMDEVVSSADPLQAVKPRK